MKSRLLLSLLLPFVACALQWWLWAYLSPYVWFLFFPVAFFSAWIGGFSGGIAATAISALLVWYVFMPKTFSFELDNPASAFSIVVFVIMGALFAFLFERLRHAMQRTGKELQVSETRFEATFEQAAVGIALAMPDGRWLRVNRKLCEIVGYGCDELLAKTFWDITHPEDVETDHANLQGMLSGDTGTYSKEKRFICKDGSHVWINLTVSLVRKPDATPDYFIAIVEDIQMRRQAEAGLQKSATQLIESQRLAGIGNWMWDTRADRHTWSEEIYYIYGRDPSLPPAIYPEVQRYFTPESWARLSAAVEKGLAEGTAYACDAEVVRPDGTHRWIIARGEAARDADGNIVNLHGTVQDITERKRAEESLRESEERLAGIIDSAMDAIISVDERQLIRLYNPAAEKMFGLGVAEATGQPLARLIPERFRHAHEGHIRNFAQTGMTARRMGLLGEVSGLRLNGEEFPVEASISQTRHAAGNLFTVILRDITDRRRAEEEILRLNADLERRVEERTAKLTIANRELDSFSYAVSHDLRAPLRAMSGFSQALGEDYGSQLQGEAKVYLEQIDIASRKMSELVDGLLVLSRSTRGELHHDEIDLTGLAHRLLDELAQGEPERQVARQVATGIVVFGDARMIEVVMRNLLGNAWKYTAHAAAPEIRVFAEERDGSRFFCVADNGAGFDMAHANRLFQPFQRLHRQEEFAGIGIGLATVQRIVHRHGGVIEARGEPGKGAVFGFTLSGKPAADSAPDKKEQ
ncbi:MAG: PAS domain S-box protein [Nitrosomonadales bacterium]|nr:PAS domain S-box protein [Nitrosomonadales bacterium]